MAHYPVTLADGSRRSGRRNKARSTARRSPLCGSPAADAENEDAVTEIGVRAIEDQVFFEKSGFGQCCAAQQKAAPRHKIARTYAAVTRCIFASPAEVIAVAVKRMDTSSGVPENIRTVVKVN